MKRIEHHLFLVLALLAVGLSVLCYFLFEKNLPGATDEQYLSAVQEHVREETQRSADELNAVAGLIGQTKKAGFSDLAVATRYPYYIYKNGQLFYWSDHRFIPDYESIKAVIQPQLVDFEGSSYIVSHRRIKQPSADVAIFSLIPIYKYYHSSNAYLQSGYNPDVFSIDPQAISTTRQLAFQAIYDHSSGFLFSVTPPKVDIYRNQSTPVNTVILATLAVVFLGLYVLRVIIQLKRRRQYERGFIWLAAYLLLLRALMLYFGVPFLFFESDLFNPRFYAASVLVPSLGDLLLNALVVLLLALYGVNHYYHSRTYRFLLTLPSWTQTLLSLGCVVASYVVYYLCYRELNSIYEKSQFTLDITLSIQFSLLKMVCLLVFISISCIYFLLLHLLVSLFIRYNRRTHLGRGLGLITLGTLIVGVLGWLIDWPLSWIFLLNGVYFKLIYGSQLPRTLYTFRYRTSIYLFLAAFVCAAMTAYVVYNQEIRKQLVQEREFASQLLAENDEFGEFLMDKAQESVARDAEISRALRVDSVLVRERIQHRVKSLHLDKYFDKYDIEVFSFRANGRPLDISPDAPSLSVLSARYQQASYKTQYPNIFFVNEVGNQFIKQYLCFIKIPQSGPVLTRSGNSATNALGYIVLDMRLRNERPKNVYPELLVDAKFSQQPNAHEYSYAVYSGKQPGSTLSGPAFSLIYSAGSYNYERKMNTQMLGTPALFTEGISANGYQHVAQRGKDGRVVVVSAEEYPFKNAFSNFSFLYLLLVLTVLVVIIGYAANYRLSRFSINYSTRIQILLNVAFFLPLLLVILIILGAISANYVANQENSYINNTRNIAANFLTYLSEHIAQKRSKASMEEELGKIARDADIDINLFDTQGRLFTSTRPLIYESGYLSKRLNPQAYIHIIDDKENQVLLNESLGTKQYRTAYAGIKSYDGKLLGILSIPYFYARPDLDRQLIEVIASALSIFTGLFLFFLVVSYFASNILTKPLRMLTQKIRKTNLDRPNDPLPWRSDDEIGLLIREYNRMLVKLEESKQELAQNEKQSAWREMAKQVAHEIKNPLTPMKLTLQQLQRTLPGNNTVENGTNDAVTRRMQRTFDSLLEQIDNLSDIATSFSDFAKMPLPKNEVFEVTGVLNKAADLYADDHRIVLRRQVSPGPVMVIGDRQLIGRILTNLIINAIQSVPTERQPVIDLRLYTKDDEAQIEVHDNGAGIPEAIHAKVFLPNFSTKRGGSGLGLAIAKRGIEHAGGTIWFETTEGVGTSFFVSLPLSKVSDSPKLPSQTVTR